MAGASQGGSLESAVDLLNFEELAYASDICTTNCFDTFACLRCWQAFAFVQLAL